MAAKNEFVSLSDPEVSEAAIAYFETVIFEGIECGSRYWVAGGSVRTWIQQKKIPKTCDVDVWFDSPGSVAAFREAAKRAEWTETKETETSVNFRTKRGFWVQAIKGHFFGGPIETIAAFDFTVCAFAVDLEGKRIIHHRDSLLDVALGRLKIVDLTFPKSTLLRAFKYRDKGFRICANQLEQVLDAIVDEEIEKRAAEDADPESEAAGRREYPWRGLD